MMQPSHELPSNSDSENTHILGGGHADGISTPKNASMLNLDDGCAFSPPKVAKPSGDSHGLVTVVQQKPSIVEKNVPCDVKIKKIRKKVLKLKRGPFSSWKRIFRSDANPAQISKVLKEAYLEWVDCTDRNSSFGLGPPASLSSFIRESLCERGWKLGEIRARLIEIWEK